MRHLKGYFRPLSKVWNPIEIQCYLFKYLPTVTVLPFWGHNLKWTNHKTCLSLLLKFLKQDLSLKYKKKDLLCEASTPKFNLTILWTVQYSHFVELTIYRSSWFSLKTDKANQSSFLENGIKRMSLRQFLAYTSLFPDFKT